MENRKPNETETAPQLEKLEARLGHTFSNRELLLEALRHRSINLDQPKIRCNQRLEFLGDAVLQLIISDSLFHRNPFAREGDLSRWRSILTRGDYLAELARNLGLSDMLEMSRSEVSTGGRTRAAALEDAFEALVGALFLDAGFVKARTIVLHCLGDFSQHLKQADAVENPKGRLQTAVQSKLGNNAIRYEKTGSEGPQHQQRFEIKVFINDAHLGTGWGSSKKEAEENAAREALEKWKSQNPT